MERRGWYDGWFYATFIDTGSGFIRDRICKLLPEGSSILDIGCGTGGFSLRMAEKAAHVTGVDISASQIEIAEKRLQKSGLKNVDFIHAHAGKPLPLNGRTYDFAVFTFVLHEMPPAERDSVLSEVKKRTRNLIVFEYSVPHPLGFWGLTTRLIEFFAGIEHNRNFLHFIHNGGTTSLLTKHGFRVARRLSDRHGIFHVFEAEPDSN